MALRLMARSPRRRIRLASVVGELAADQARSGRLRLRATWHQQRVSGPHGFAVRNERRSSCAPLSAHGRPALRIRFAPDAAASTASHPASVTIAKRPSLGWDAADLSFDLPDGLSGIFCCGGVDCQNHIEIVQKIGICAQLYFDCFESEPEAAASWPDPRRRSQYKFSYVHARNIPRPCPFPLLVARKTWTKCIELQSEWCSGR